MTGPRRVALGDLDFSEWVRPGDVVMWGHACGEPVTLVERLLAQRHGIGPFSAVLGVHFSRAVRPEHADVVAFSGFAGVGTVRALVKAGTVEIAPWHLSAFERAIRRGEVRCDVALLQVARTREGGFSFGASHDYIGTAARQARVVVAEVSDAVPATRCDPELGADDIDVLVETAGRPHELRRAPVGDVERRIARHAAGFIPERACLQVGIGAIPDSILSDLRSGRGLGVHSGIIGDAVADLVECGAVTNGHKSTGAGVTVTGGLMGSDRLYRFADGNPDLLLCPVSRTHGFEVLAGLDRFTSVNSALEVDLTGQVNAEAIGSDYVGTVGGQVDFVRAAAASRGGVSIIALPAATGAGAPRIVARLAGPVTTPRSDVGVVVTEHGAADLRGRTLRQRAERMIALAAPEHREALERDWRAGEGAARA